MARDRDQTGGDAGSVRGNARFPRSIGAAVIVGAAALAALPAPARAQPADEASAAKTESKPLEIHAEVVQRGPFKPWLLRLQNVSDEGARVVTDPRLLWFDAVVPDKKKPVLCRLPSDMFPRTAYQPAVMELLPGESIVRTFDPRFFCFSEKDNEVLVPGAELTPTFGWPRETKTVWRKGKKVEEPLPDSPPYVAEPMDADSTTDPIKNVQATPIRLGDSYSALVNPKDEPPGDAPILRISRGVDARNERAVLATVELENPTDESMVIFFRRELVTFEVLGPDGYLRCEAAPDDRFPDKGAFLRLSPGETTRITSRVVELCPRGTFSRPGFYLLHAEFNAIVDGSLNDLDAFTGMVRTRFPVPVRVHEGEEPFRLAPRDPEAPDAQPEPPAPMGEGEPKRAPEKRRNRQR